MRKNLKKAALAVVALTCVGAAHAVVIDFEQPLDSPYAPNAPLFGDSDEFYQSGFAIDTYSNALNSQPGDLVGAVVDGSDLANTCFSVLCPSNNPTHFYTGLNDGYLAIGAVSGDPFTVKSFDASFVAGSGALLPSVPGLIRIQGIKADGSGSITNTFNLGGPSAAGALSFQSYTTSASFAATPFAYIFVFGFVCNAAGSCSAFASDQGQFAIDNLSVDVVPEPAQWTLMALGLAAIGAAGRRRRA